MGHAHDDRPSAESRRPFHGHGFREISKLLTTLRERNEAIHRAVEARNTQVQSVIETLEKSVRIIQSHGMFAANTALASHVVMEASRALGNPAPPSQTTH